MANLGVRFFRYCSTTLGLGQQWETVRDQRKSPSYGLEVIAPKLMAGIVTGVDSVRQMAKVIQEGMGDKVAGRSRPSDDTLSYALKGASVTDLKAIHHGVLTKARHNKALAHTNVAGYRVYAVDGTGVFSTVKTRPGQDSHYRKGIHGETLKAKVYREHALAVSYVGGSGPKPLLALERIPSGVGETTMAIRVLDELYKTQFRYCDIVTADALYAGAPFIQCVRDQHKDVVIRVKQDQYALIQDADALFAEREPDYRYERVRRGEKRVFYALNIWDDEEFTSWETVAGPLRCLRIEVVKTHEKADGKIISKEEYTTHLVTSCPMNSVPARTVWEIAHARWDIENTGFHVLKTQFRLEHAYGYSAAVVGAMLALFLLSYTCFQLFVRRNLRWFDPKKHSLKEIIRQIHDGLVEIRQCKEFPDLIHVALE